MTDISSETTTHARYSRQRTIFALLIGSLSTGLFLTTGLSYRGYPEAAEMRLIGIMLCLNLIGNVLPAFDRGYILWRVTGTAVCIVAFACWLLLALGAGI